MTDCGNCYLFVSNFGKTSRDRVTKIANDKPILFIGDVATITDVKQKSVFSGKTTKIVKQYITDYKLTNYCNCINLVRCPCKGDEAKWYVKHCINYTIRDIVLAQPSIIVAVGAMTYRNLKDENNKNYNKVVNKPIMFNNSIMIPIHSPVHIHKENIYDSYTTSFELIADILAEINYFYRAIR